LYIIKHQYLNGNGSSLCPGGPKPLSPLTLEKVFKKFTKFNDVELSILILTEKQQGGHRQLSVSAFPYPLGFK
jgi:hypothetical protein